MFLVYNQTFWKKSSEIQIMYSLKIFGDQMSDDFEQSIWHFAKSSTVSDGPIVPQELHDKTKTKENTKYMRNTAQGSWHSGADKLLWF